MTRHLRIEAAPLREFCTRWRVDELSLFGSALRDDFGPDSDVDVLVSFASDADWSLLDLVRMEREFAELVGRRVDLVDRRSVVRSQNWLRREEILRTAVRLYAA